MDVNAETLQLANTLKAITDRADPETRKAALELIQKKVPGTHFSELETDKISKTMDAKFAEFEHRQATKDATHQLETQRGKLTAMGYTDADIKSIETDVMQKHGISDYEVAAKVYQADQPAPAPTYDIRGQKPWKRENLEGFFGKPREKAREMAAQISAEMRSNPQGRKFA